MPEASLTADAEIVARNFKADAWIMGERWKHHRLRDHSGADSDLYVVLSEDIGKYVSGTPIHWVIADIAERIFRLENYNQARGSFVADSWLALSGTWGRGHVVSDAVFLFSASGSFKADAVLMAGGTFTADAVIMPSFTADAYIVLAT